MGGEDGVDAALTLDGGDFNGSTITVQRALPPAEGKRLKVYVGGLPFKADEETLRKDFGECGEITKFRMLRDDSGRPKGVVFITYATESGVTKALAYNKTEYGGRTIQVRITDAKSAASQ